MSIELERPGSGVAAFMLSLSTLLVLGKKGTLNKGDLAEVVEEALAKLKGVDSEPSLQSQAAWGKALYLLEQLRASLARDPHLNARIRRVLVRFRRTCGDICGGDHVDRHLVAGSTASDLRTAPGTAEGRVAGFVSTIYS